jgi:hypothetical protein
MLGRFRCTISGTRHPEKQTVLKTEVHRGDRLILEREPLNEFDPNCIRVLTTTGKWIGYVPKETAAEVAPILDGTVGNVTIAKVRAVKESIREGTSYLTIEIDIVINPTITFRIDLSTSNTSEDFMMKLNELKEAARRIGFTEYDRSASIKEGLAAPESKRRNIKLDMAILEKLVDAMVKYDFRVKHVYEMYCNQVPKDQQPALPTFYALIRKLRTTQLAQK